MTTQTTEDEATILAGDELDYNKKSILQRTVNVLMYGIIGGLIVSALIVALTN